MSKIYFVLPAYNEEANIASTIKQWYPVVEKAGPDCRLVIANDGSKDRTYEIMERQKEHYPQFIPLTKPNQGHGPTVIFLSTNTLSSMMRTLYSRQTLMVRPTLMSFSSSSIRAKILTV